MDPITTTIATTLDYTPTVALLTLPDTYHTTVAVQASFTVGDVWIIFLLVILIGVEMVNLVKKWRH